MQTWIDLRLHTSFHEQDKTLISPLDETNLTSAKKQSSRFLYCLALLFLPYGASEAMRINHNISATNAYNHLGSSGSRLNQSMGKLSSGLRINKAGDDAAGLAISEKMRAQIRGLNQESRNTQNGISVIQIAEGALAETGSILSRMKELALQSENVTDSTDRAALKNEVKQLKQELDRMSKTQWFQGNQDLGSDLTDSDKANIKFVFESLNSNLISKEYQGEAGEKLAAESVFKSSSQIGTATVNGLGAGQAVGTTIGSSSVSSPNIVCY